MTSTMRVEHLTFSYVKNMKPVLDDISFTARPGEITTIIGANGTGKTTMLKCMARLLKSEGSIYLDDKIPTYDELTDKVSYMEQNTDCAVDLTVFEVVMLGLVKSLGFRVSDEDIERVNNVMELVGITHLAGSKISEISGGQRQLAFIAQAMVKQPDVLILDEPTSALDLYHQFTLVNFIRDITKKTNCTTIMTLHHLDVALKYSDRVIVLDMGHVYKDAGPNEVFVEETLYDVYRVFSRIEVDENGDKHLVVLRPRTSSDPKNWAELMKMKEAENGNQEAMQM
ncbi:iron ABC transporter ATP-binding protein [methanogenic archaeon mixed culture ISO4-G1]|nr:iron ABC transporter ATP-binding protein [methanogenic archaeon mixed culture ISO4-G1]